MTSTGIRVLVVDDNPANLRLAEFVLRQAGFEVRTARSARETRLTLVGFHPNVVLMDLQLPEVDGLTLTRQLRTDAATSHLCIVAMTAYAMSGDADRARDAGCDGYAAKPVSPADMIAIVHRYAH